MFWSIITMVMELEGLRRDFGSVFFIEKRKKTNIDVVICNYIVTMRETLNNQAMQEENIHIICNLYTTRGISIALFMNVMLEVFHDTRLYSVLYHDLCCLWSFVIVDWIGVVYSWDTSDIRVLYFFPFN